MTFTSGTFFLFNTVVPKRPARPQPVRGNGDECVCRAASSTARRSPELSGGSTGVSHAVRDMAKGRADDNRRKSGVRAGPENHTGGCADLSDSRLPASILVACLQAGGEPAGRSQVPRARIRAPISYYLREVPYARRSNRRLVNSSHCERSAVPAGERRGMVNQIGLVPLEMASGRTAAGEGSPVAAPGA